MRRFDHGGDIYAHRHPVLDFSANINPLGYPPGLKEALIANLDSFQHYPDARCRELTQAIASHHGVKPQQVLCGNGAADLIYRICACIKPQKALIAAPTFSEYERAVKVYGGQVLMHPLKEENYFDVDQGILNAITEEIQIVFLCSPNNPTGRIISPALLLEVVKHCQKVGAYLVLDECFIDFTSGRSMTALFQEHQNLLILRAFTKTYAMAGLRLGYLMAANEELLETIATYGATWSVSSPAQIAGLAALKATNWPNQTRVFVREERKFLHKELQTLGLQVFPGEANYLLCKSDKLLYRPLLAKGVLVRDCGNYTGLSSHFIRVSIQTRDKNLRLLASLQEVLHG